MNPRSIIVLEANEVPLRIFDYYCSLEPSSATARVMKGAAQYSTRTEDKARFIMPWTTWPSMHRGVSDELHQIFKFGQWESEGGRLYPPIWSLLADQGIRTGVFSSMQSSPLPPDSRKYSFYFPDMFSAEADTAPAHLRVLQEFSLAMTRENARNVSRRLDVGLALPVVQKTRSLGIRPRTYAGIARQLASELIEPARKTRRRALQPLLMLDAYMKLLRETRPQFSTFFTNHVAAAMHRYWAAAFPQDYDKFEMDAGWVRKYRGEIRYAMSRLNLIVEQFASFVDSHPDYELVIATSMGQGAIPSSHVKEFLTVTALPKFLARLGVPWNAAEERPAMVPDFSVRLTDGLAADLEQKLAALRIGGQPVKFHRDASFIYFSVYDERPGIDSAELQGLPVPLSELGLSYLIHEDEVSCTAQHTPDGTLLIYSPHSNSTPDHRRAEISTLEFAPAVLEHFGLHRPEYMVTPSFHL